MKNKSLFKINITIVLLLAFMLPTQIMASTTIISNSVSVTSNNGVNQAHIKTVQNGEVIEDTTIATTSAINYYSENTSSSYETKIKTTSAATGENNEELLTRLNSLISELRTILAYYEKLLNK